MIKFDNIDDLTELSVNSVVNADCLDAMKLIVDKSVDMILCDLPYGTTACSWDTIIPFEPLWEQYKRIIKDNGAIVLTASQPFTSALVMSNPKMFKYEWIWYKNRGSNFALLKYQPFKEHESVLVFSKETAKYYPIMEERSESGKNRCNYTFNNKVTNKTINNETFYNQDGERRKLDENLRNPSSVKKFNTEVGIHPTQKPVALFEYMIKTYTNEGDLVLDNCAGSGTTAIACLNTNRNYILIEKERKYYDVIVERIANHTQTNKINNKFF
jgi:site-specific DNA-methyltransferase (adenine-specific)